MQIANDGPRIVASDYWATPQAARGLVYCSINAGHLRLLMAAVSTELAQASEVIITRGPWPPHAPDALEVMFEDGSNAPYAYHIAPPMLDRVPPASQAGRALTCTVWTAGPTCRLTLPARFRVAATLPHMQPWA